MSGHGIDSTGSTGINSDPQNETIKDAGSQTNIEENQEKEKGSSERTDEQVKIIENLETETVTNEDTGSQTISEENQKNERGSNEGTNGQVIITGNLETETVVNENARCQTNIRESQGKEQGSRNGIDEQVKNKDNSETVIVVNNHTRCQINIEKNQYKRQRPCTILSNNGSAPDNLGNTTVEYYNIIIPGNEELNFNTDSGVSNWIKMKIILAQHSGSISSFYTTSDKVEFQYKIPETQKTYRKVNIYFVAEQSQSYPENTIMDFKDKNDISFEDVVNEDTKSYIQIPVTLNEEGAMLEPLIFGPLPAGSYWILVTSTENETASSGLGKKILSANCFKVLKFEMNSKTPDNVKTGENFDVNLALKNPSSQENCTYWGALIKENPQGANATTNSTAAAKDKFETFMQELFVIQKFSLNSPNCNSTLSKKELQNEINTLIGISNGTINIGEGNQSTLSLTSLGLLPGNYRLFAGAYEKGYGLVGITQKKLTIVSSDTSTQTQSP